MKQNVCNLGQDSIGKLLLKFSVPCVISMIVAALYNIVDQIFIGWSAAGAFGNAATNIVYPVTVFVLGFSLLVGDGASANFSLRLGAKDKENAGRSIGNGILLLLIVSVFLTAIGLIFKTQILCAFGANPNETICYEYANDYYTVICMGIPFYVIGQGLNGTIRADGSPRYAMLCTLLGAIANIVLDPIFIFVLNRGVEGAAIATVIGQILTFIMSIAYLFKPKNFNLNKDTFKLRKDAVLKSLSLGLSSLIVQVSIVIIATVNNNLFGKYGYETVSSTGEIYGAIIPLAVVGIVLKVFGIVISVAVGISLGGQPIIGYNMGAGNVERVKKCIKYITLSVAIVGAVSFMAFELIPDAIISIFGSNSAEYMEFARLCMRIFLGGIILTCYIKSTSIILQSMGNSVKSTIVALSRDVIIFVPVSVTIASLSHNIVTMLYSAVIADIIGALVAGIMIYTEIKKLGKHTLIP